MKRIKNYKSIDFRAKVLAVVKGISRGKTLSYKEVATKAGHPLAARAVGAIMRTNNDKTIPCHRVIKSDGTLGGYNGLQGIKLKLLRKEGVHI